MSNTHADSQHEQAPAAGGGRHRGAAAHSEESAVPTAGRHRRSAPASAPQGGAGQQADTAA